MAPSAALAPLALALVALALLQSGACRPQGPSDHFASWVNTTETEETPGFAHRVKEWGRKALEHVKSGYGKAASYFRLLTGKGHEAPPTTSALHAPRAGITNYSMVDTPLVNFYCPPGKQADENGECRDVFW